MIKLTDIFRFGRYSISGGVGIIIDFILFSTLIIFANISYIISNIVSFSLCAIVVFYLQKNWTFKYHSKSDVTLYVRYIAGLLFTFFFNTVTLFILISIFLIDPITSKMVQIFLSTIQGYWIQKYFIFIYK
jgi:putative flippase GtrA